MSRLLAAILMRSSKLLGSRSEIEVEDGFRLGSRVRSALFQSTWSAESLASQKARSSASVLNTGTFLMFLAVDLSLLSAHVPGGNHPDFGLIHSQRECHMQQPVVICAPQGVNARFIYAVTNVGDGQQRLVEKTCSASAWLTSCFFSLLRAFPASQSKPFIRAQSIMNTYCQHIHRIQVSWRGHDGCNIAS